MQMTADPAPIHAWMLCEQIPENKAPSRRLVSFDRAEARNALQVYLLELEFHDGYTVEVYGIQDGEQVFCAERDDDYRLLWIEPERTCEKFDFKKPVWN